MNVRKVLKKVVSLVTAIVVGSLITTSVLAVPASSQSAELKSLSAKYGLRDGTLPKGMKPLVFNSVKEADIFLQKINMNIPTSPKPIMAKPSSNNFGACTYGEDSQMVRFWLFGWVSGYTTYEFIWDGTQNCNIYSQCYSVSSGMSGLTVGISYDQVSGSTWSKIEDGGKTLKTGFTGHLAYYLLVKGVIKVGDVTKNYTATYTNP